MKLFAAVSLALSLFACNKKHDDAKVAKDAATAVAPVDKVATPDAAAAAPPTENPPPNKPEEGSAAAAVDPDCQALEEMLGKCTGHEDTIAKAAAQCTAALAKNNVMAPSLRAQIACLKGNATCQPFEKCMAGIK